MKYWTTKKAILIRIGELLIEMESIIVCIITVRVLNNEHSNRLLVETNKKDIQSNILVASTL